ncbi:hypothetical protein [Saccharibacillus sp. O23]|uniref:hypothetical protein n=1 Tax=Saccharibacillus sp. O23 TaxID=2009338 RepID=UPI00117A9449|nr:hypothetical protein [Saccharibacillus sp. O23]
MKKLVTLTASALLMASFATAASAAETTPTTTPTTTPATTETAPTTTPTAPATVVSTSTTTKFVGNDKGFSFTNPTTWNERVKSQEYTGQALKDMGESGVYLVNFTYTPNDTNAAPVTFASIRGYDSGVWNSIANKDALGKPLNETGSVIYVLSPAANNPFTSGTDMETFNTLLQGVNSGVLQDFTINPVMSTGEKGPLVVVNDPSKISDNPTPTINLTSMTPFYKSPGGTMIGYLGPQKLDTTGNGKTDPASGQWVEIYTWMGLAWIVVE